MRVGQRHAQCNVVVVRAQRRTNALFHVAHTTFCGTPAYMAPEVLMNKGRSREALVPYDVKADVWSLGIVLFVLISGVLPWSDSMPTELQISYGRIEFDDPCWSKVPKVIQDLVLQLTAPSPCFRIQAVDAYEHACLCSAILM